MDAFIFDAIRTPRGRGKKSGALHSVKPYRLLGDLLRELPLRQAFDTQAVDKVIMGCVNPVEEQGGDIAKVACLDADWPDSVPGVQINTFCASGLEAVNMAAMHIKSGSTDCIVAGGVEMMSRIPIDVSLGPLFSDRELQLKVKAVPQGISADLIATLDNFTREQVDAFALGSQKRAALAINQGSFERSIIPVKNNEGEILLAQDEHPRADSSMEGLAALKPSFKKLGEMGFDELAMQRYTEIDQINHVHTPANSSGIVDGAAAVLIGSEAFAKRFNLTPRARILATTLISTDPTIMLIGPAPATYKVLKQANLNIDDIDLFEVNEAFSSVVLHFMQETGVSHEKINVNGGAIALGHPVGATGAMLLGTCLDELERRQARYGLITLCAGGGMGVATIIERLG